MTLYKSFDSSQFLLEVLWKEFPNIKTTVDGDKIYNTLVVTSQEFCQLAREGKINIKFFTQGGFGKIGKLRLNDKIIKTAIYSFSREQNGLFYTDMLVKISLKPTPQVITRIDYRTLSFTDPLSDMIFGSMLGHLYDIGVCPFVAKYFGNYVCEGNQTAITLEAAHHELYEKLERKATNRLTPAELKNILIQYIYCLFIMKIYFGVIHYDSHLRNIMLLDLKINQEYMYHGKQLKDVDVIFFETGLVKDNIPIIVAIKKSDYIIKLIDYGCMFSCLDRSKFQRFKKDIRVVTDIRDMTRIGADRAFLKSIESVSYSNTVDLMFTLINIYHYLFHGLDRNDLSSIDLNAPIHNIEYINVVNEITRSVINVDMTQFLDNNTKHKMQKKSNGEFQWFMTNRDCGILKGYECADFFTKAMINCCNKSITVDEFPFEHTVVHNKKVHIVYFEDITEYLVDLNVCRSVFLTFNISDYDTAFTRFEQLIHHENNCSYKPESCIITNLYKNRSLSETFQDVKNLINNKYFKLITKTSSYQNNPSYRDYNSWLNYNPIPRSKMNSHIEDVKFNIIQIFDRSKISFFKNSKLIQSNGISLPIGNNVFLDKQVKTFGFYANYLTNTVETFPYPKIYNNYLAIMRSNHKSNDLAIEKYTNFLGRHITNELSMKLNNEEYSDIDIIATPLNITSGETYTWAVTIGPILVWDRKLIFDESLLELETLSESGLPIVYQGNSTTKAFDGKTSGYFGMTDSKEIQSHIVYIEENDKKGFLLIEGGGYSSTGLDRFQVAKLCMSLGATNAILIQSGYGSNILYKDGEILNYVSSCPFRTRYGTILDFSF